MGEAIGLLSNGVDVIQPLKRFIPTITTHHNTPPTSMVSATANEEMTNCAGTNLGSVENGPSSAAAPPPRLARLAAVNGSVDEGADAAGTEFLLINCLS